MDIADFANQYMEEFNLQAVTTLLQTSSQTSRGTPHSHCLECHSPIPAERRRIVPGCDLCVECAGLKERQASLFAGGSDKRHNPSPTSENNMENSC